MIDAVEFMDANRESLPCIDRLRILTARSDPFLAYCAEWLSQAWNVSIEISVRPDALDLRNAYRITGATDSAQSAVIIPRSPVELEAPPLLDNFGAIEVAALRGRFPFDFFEAVRFWMTDRAHADLPDDAYDQHARLRFDRSIFARMGDSIAPPIASRYAALLKRMIEHKFGGCLPDIWPHGKKAVVVLSHDVDAPLNQYALSTALHQAAACARHRGLLASVYGLTAAARQRAARALRGAFRVEERWLFGHVATSEIERGFHSTFFFAPRHCWSPSASPRDVRYDLRAKRFRPMFKHLNQQGFEIALHASYNVMENCTLLDEEIRELSDAAGCEIVGNRHHFWRLGRPMWETLCCHERGGLAYDSSIAFNDGLGWRMGIGLPFEPWDEREQRAIRVLQLPVMLMDGVLWYDRPNTAQVFEENLARFDALIDMLVRHNAAGSIDWHDGTSYPARSSFQHWGRFYLAILDRLAARSDIWVTTCRDVLHHWRGRGSVESA